MKRTRLIQILILLAAAGLSGRAAAQAGPVLCCGDNLAGELGNNSNTNANLIAPAFNISGIKSISSGAHHVLALTTDGLVYAWGSNTSGQLGLGDVNNRSTPQLIPGLNHIIAIAAGGSSSYALNDEGNVHAWGNNNVGQLGIGFTANKLSPVLTGGGQNVKAIAAGRAHFIALGLTGGLIGTGENTSGQLGIGNFANQGTFVPAMTGTPRATAIAAGDSHSVLLTSDGRVFSAGSDGSGQLGDGGGANKTTFTFSNIGSARAIGSGPMANHTIAVRVDGTIAGWGANLSGQLGLGNTVSQALPTTMIGVENAKAAAAGTEHTLILLANGKVMAVGNNVAGQLGNGTNTNKTVAVIVNNTSLIQQVTAGSFFSVGLKCFSAAKAWGRNANGQLGIGSTLEKHAPAVMNGLTSGVLAVATGSDHTLALKADGTVYACGHNNFGQLGLGTLADSTKPVKIPTLANVTAISAGGDHNLALTADGWIWAWGRNNSGQLGQNDTIDRPSPVRVGWGATKVSAGYAHSLAIVWGDMWSWGANARGQLGLGYITDNFNDHWTPQKVVFNESDFSNVPTFIAISAGDLHNLALDDKGTVFAWGDDNAGQIAFGATSAFPQSSPGSTLGVSNQAKALAAGGYHSLHLSTDGDVYIVGLNDHGQLGDGTTTEYVKWVLQRGPFSDIACGYLHTLQAQATGALLACGFNFYGQLGDGTTTDRHSLVLVPGLPYCTGLGGGHGFHSAALTTPPVMLSSFKVAPTGVTGGASATGTVTLTSAAGPGGLTVSLQVFADNPPITVPPAVFVPAGAKTATFAISTKPVTATVKITIGAKLVVTKNATLTVNP